MDRKYLSAPFDMSEYIYGKRFVLGGRDYDLEDKKEDEKTAPKKEAEVVSLEKIKPDLNKKPA